MTLEGNTEMYFFLTKGKNTFLIKLICFYFDENIFLLRIVFYVKLLL